MKLNLRSSLACLLALGLIQPQALFAGDSYLLPPEQETGFGGINGSAPDSAPPSAARSAPWGCVGGKCKPGPNAAAKPAPEPPCLGKMCGNGGPEKPTATSPTQPGCLSKGGNCTGGAPHPAGGGDSATSPTASDGIVQMNIDGIPVTMNSKVTVDYVNEGSWWNTLGPAAAEFVAAHDGPDAFFQSLSANPDQVMQKYGSNLSQEQYASLLGIVSAFQADREYAGTPGQPLIPVRDAVVSQPQPKATPAPAGNTTPPSTGNAANPSPAPNTNPPNPVSGSVAPPPTAGPAPFPPLSETAANNLETIGGDVPGMLHFLITHGMPLTDAQAMTLSQIAGAAKPLDGGINENPHYEALLVALLLDPRYGNKLAAGIDNGSINVDLLRGLMETVAENGFNAPGDQNAIYPMQIQGETALNDVINAIRGGFGSYGPVSPDDPLLALYNQLMNGLP